MDKKNKELELLRGLEKLKASKVRSDDYTSPLNNDKMYVRGKSPVSEIAPTVIKNATDKIDTKSVMPMTKNFQSKIQALLKNGAAKKALGIIPYAGAAAGALSGDPAMAAEEAAGDIPILGQAYEAIRPDVAGDPNERQMIAENDALKNYNNSPAKADRLAKIRQLMGEK